MAGRESGFAVVVASAIIGILLVVMIGAVANAGSVAIDAGDPLYEGYQDFKSGIAAAIALGFGGFFAALALVLHYFD